MMQYLDILIFAVIAVVLLMRLRSVLGERDEGDVPPLEIKPQNHDQNQINQQTNPVAGAAALHNQNADAAQVNAMPDRWAQNMPNYDIVTTATVHNQLTQFLAVDPRFRPDDFLDKAQKAFGMVIRAYSEGALSTLEFLLAPSLYAAFAEQIEGRQKANETFFIHLHGVKKALIARADLDGTVATLGVDFIAEQAITHKDANGHIINDHGGQRRMTKDHWVFRKNLKDPSPVWQVVETSEMDD